MKILPTQPELNVVIGLFSLSILNKPEEGHLKMCRASYYCVLFIL